MTGRRGGLDLICDLLHLIPHGIQWSLSTLACLSSGIDEFMKSKLCGPCSSTMLYGSYSLPLVYSETTQSCQRLSRDLGRRGQGSGTPYWMGCSDKDPGRLPSLPLSWQQATVTFPINDSPWKQQGDLNALCLTSFKLALFFFFSCYCLSR